MKRLCTICARGGSKGVKNKNLRTIAGKPLISWSVLQARASGLFDVIAVSSDSQEIIATALGSGADHAIARPADLAADTAAKVPAISHAVRETEKYFGYAFDTLVDLDATAPLRLPSDITGAVALLETSGSASVITGTRAHRSPYFNLVERTPDGFVCLSKSSGAEIVRRQDAPEAFDMNASIYAWRRYAFAAEPRVFYSDTRLYEMPPERSHDIDSEIDFEIVGFLFDRLGISAFVKELL